MKLYRVVQSDNKIANDDVINGVNTFDYVENEDYIHFFVLPEHAEIFKKLKFTNSNMESLIYQVDIPYEIIQDCFGAGMYVFCQPRVRHAFLEVRIKKQDFDKKYIVEKSENIKSEWKNDEVYERWFYHCVGGRFTKDYKYVERCQPVKILSFVDLKVELNKNFNFLHYFPKDDLAKENISVADYPQKLEKIEKKDIVEEKDTKKEENNNLLSKLKKLSSKINDKLREQDKAF